MTETAEHSHSIWAREPELDLRLRELVDLGLSYGKIANIMGLTRNQVIGRAVRLGLKKSSARQVSPPTSGWKVIKDKAKERFERARQQAKAQRLGQYQTPASALRRPPSVEMTDTVSRIEDFVPHGERRGIMDIRDSQCRWPIGDPQRADFHFCHRDSLAGLPYCHAHSVRALHPELVASRLPEVPKPTMTPVKEPAD